MFRVRKQACALVTLLTAAALATAVPATAADLPVAVTAGAMAAPQVDGIVFTVAIVGDTVFAGGRFSKARPAGVAPGGAGEVDRHNLLAFSLTTGKLLPWAPDVSGSQYTSATNPGPFCKTVGANTYVCDTVFRIKKSPDNTRIYVGGDFDKINGQWRSRLAAFDIDDGALALDFKPTVAGRVRGIAVTQDTVYAGGGFKKVNGVNRDKLAAFAFDGTMRDWAPTADAEVYALAPAPDFGRVLIGGQFDKSNGVSHHGWNAVDAYTGADAPWNNKLGVNDVITDIVTDGTTAYAGGFNSIGPDVRYEGRVAVDIESGALNWSDGCYGDTQAVTVSRGVLYSASHTHDCSAIGAAPENGPIDYYRLVAETAAATGTAPATVNTVRRGDPIPEMLPWFPNTNAGPADSYWKNGTWALDSTDKYVVAGGEFTTVNGKAQQGLVRFAARGVTGAVNKGPQTPFRAPSLEKDDEGSVLVTWTGTWDAQNSDITYRVYRVGVSAPLYEETQPSRPWELPEMSYLDRDAPGGGTYYIRAVDADGVVIGSPQASI
ncbi:hypothetical protein AB5J62_16140 [Amycolatopsis sp. cg5]|uniref:hypothetical protein n=1 Tax=Amycolatopsis sp. cg5 TaxID=3238802 RepID=UPI00352388C5